jgi:putative hydrolase of HD superfamily
MIFVLYFALQLSGNMMDASSASRMIDFLLYIGKLKTLKRTGWIVSKVELPESDSDHMHRAAMCAMLIPADGTVDRDKCIKMALTHDVCECIAGDYTPACPITKDEKHRLEREALITLKCVLGDSSALGDELIALFDEYEQGTSAEALFVKDIDKFELILQAHEYEQAQGLKLDSFFASTRGYFKTDLFRSLDAELMRRRTSP